MNETVPPTLSVVVGLISGSPDDLRRCLESFARQVAPPPYEILVPYDPPCADVAQLAAEEAFRDVRFIAADHLDTERAREGGSREHHDTLRTIGIAKSTGEIVALTEDHATVSETWCADMVRLIRTHPGVAAIGGAVECGSDRLLNRAVHLCDFGRYKNPLPEGPAHFVSDSNVAYRREALEEIRSVWADDYHETLVHDALVAGGHEIWLTPHSKVWQCRFGISWRDALRERVVWARSYAGTRVSSDGLPRRVVLAALSCLLPFVLTWRLLAGELRRSNASVGLVVTLPIVFALQLGWALGEFVGYVTGRPDSDG